MSTQPNTPQGQSNTNPCEELEALLPAYSIGATNAQETALVESLLSECPEVASELPEFVALSGAMLERVEPIAPPVGLHDKLMSALADQTKNDAPVQTPPPKIPSKPSEKIMNFPKRRRIAVAVASVAVILLVLTNIIWLALYNVIRTDRDMALSVMGAYDFDNIIPLIDENAQRVTLSDTTATTDVAYVLWNPTVEQALFYTDGLSPLAEHLIYQLWLIDGTGRAISTGFLPNFGEGGFTLLFNPSAPLPDFSAIAISIEPEGGSEQPTSNPIAIGEL